MGTVGDAQHLADLKIGRLQFLAAVKGFLILGSQLGVVAEPNPGDLLTLRILNLQLTGRCDVEHEAGAGLSNLEILRTATGNAARAFGLPIGEVSPGGAANFVLLSANPLENMENLRMVEQVWKNGKPN